MKISGLASGVSPRRGDMYRIAARIRYRSRWIPDDTLWIDVPAALAGQASRTGSPWLAALLPLGMVLHEDIELDQPVDENLLAHAEQLMDIWSGWYPDLKPIGIRAQIARPPAETSSRVTGVFFSGGVDSFYSVLYDRAEQGGTIDELIFIDGADIALDNRPAFGRVMESIERVAQAWRLPVVTMATNLRETRFRETDLNYLSNGSLLAAVGLALEPRYHKILISSAWPQGVDRQLGSHPDTDPLFSTGSTTFVHYGDWADRIAKTEYVSHNTLALENLRVCWESDDAGNCGRCLKCFRTMAVLDISGALPNCRTFPTPSLDLGLLSRQYLGREELYFEKLIEFADERGRPDVAGAIRAAFARTKRIDRVLLLGVVRSARRRWRHNAFIRRLAGPIVRPARQLARRLNRRLPW